MDWTIEARKYDQRPHITLPVKLVEDNGTRLLLRLPAGAIVEHHTRGWIKPAERRNDFYFWRDRWYNIFVGYESDGSLRSFYCNVALPPVIENHTVVFVDLDIDVRIWPDGRYELLDLGEFRDHAVAYRYPADVQRAAYDAMLDILIRWRARRSPFDLLDGGEPC
jgi:protein associated with RNAse G/E